MSLRISDRPGAIHCFFDADLRCGHEGLKAAARKQKVRVDDLSPGQYVLFINTAKNKMKVYTHANIVAYMRLEGRRLTLDAIQNLPKAFLAKDGMALSQVMQTMILDQLGEAKEGKAREAA